MKRFILLIGAILLSLALRAQSVTYTCRYWFDQNHAQSTTATFSESTCLVEIDVGTLSEGLHTLFLQISDTSSVWNVPKSYLFYKTLSNQPTLTYCYWFDEDITNQQNGNNGNGHLLLDVNALDEGLHLLHIMMKGDDFSIPQNYMFYKVEHQQGISNIVYHCWFDQDIEHRQTDSLGDGHLLLDVDGLSEGIHSVNVMLEGNAPESYMFMKMEVQDPTAEVQYRCWFDDDDSTIQTGLVGTGIFELEVSGLSDGIHTVHLQLNNGISSVPQCYKFYKRHTDGCIVKWAYWLNGDFANRHITNLSPFVDTLDIIALLPVETWPIRSTCFHFQPNGEEPYLNAKNEITFRFWDVDKHFIDKSTFYIDENVSEPIVADTLERNTTVCIAAPRDNQIHWFKMNVNRGDYLSFQADKACTMQLFAPSGEEIYAVSGPESIQEIGFNVWEDGVYYLAVHDVTGSGETVSVTYNWLNRYAIASYDVHLIGNGGCSTITFQGNGFNSLLDAYLVNYQNDTIRQLDIGHESNTTTTMSFNFYEENPGVYDAVFQFYEETIRINGALEVQEPVDIVLTSTVSYPSRFLRNTPCTYTYTITNNGNMSAYVVPIYVYVSSQTKDGISHLEIDGLNLPSIVDGMDMDSLSERDKAILIEWADEIGDDHYFLKTASIDEETGDSIYVRSNLFFLNFAPFETKTLTIRITSDEPINLWMTVPDVMIQPYNIDSNRDAKAFCCLMTHFECYFGIMSSDANKLAFFVDVLALAFPQLAHAALLVTTAACIVSVFNAGVNLLEGTICNEEQGLLNKILWPFYKSGWSLVGMALSCLPSYKQLETAYNALHPGSVFDFGLDMYLYRIQAIGDIIQDELARLTDTGCDFSSKSLDCLPGPPKGGGASPVYSLDPNDIHGYLSESGSHYMRQEIQNVQYEIEFENDTTLATAAAHTIIVRDTLDATKFDLNSLAARSVTIGDKRLDLNGEQTFARTLDLRPELYVIAQIEQDYDPTTGIIQWTIQSLDPMTMEPTNDPNQGVLPVNYYGNGVGFIDYSINLLEPFADGTAINNRAGIIFDQNDVIMTPTWTNIVDAVKPVSYIESAELVDDSLSFNFVSSDNRSGVWYHTLYYRNDSTEMEWKVKVPKIEENNYMLQFKEYQTTEYLVMAIDSAGNHEEKELVAEYVYYYDGPEPMCQTSALVQGWNWWSTYLDITLDDLKSALVATGNNAITIKSKNNGNTTYNGNIWRGQLNMLDVTQMYRISVGTDCEITLEGVSFNPAEHPVTIVPGVNWIGFPLCESMSLSNAFAEFTVSGDMVKSKNQGIATYNGTQWRGSLNTLVPGQGYIYKSTTTEDRILTFPVGTK